MLATYCKAKGSVLSDLMKPKYMQIVQEKYGFKDWDSILAALGHGGLKEGQIVNRLAEEYSKDHRKELTDESVLEKVAEAAKNKVHITRSKSGIVVKGIDDMAVRFSRCCNPVPGDEIVGLYHPRTRNVDPPDGLCQYHSSVRSGKSASDPGRMGKTGGRYR